MVKSLYTLRLSSGYNDLLNSENLKVDIGKLCHDIEVCNFTLLQLTKNYVNNIFKQDTVNIIVFTLELIYSTVITSNRDGVKYMKYLYLKYLNTFFKVIESISNTLRKKVFVFVFKYITEVFEISNTFSNTFKYI